MNGPAHYAEAERLARQAQYFTYGDGGNPAVGAALAAEARVHATLALVALTFAGLDTRSDHSDLADREAWRQVTS